MNVQEELNWGSINTSSSDETAISSGDGGGQWTSLANATLPEPVLSTRDLGTYIGILQVGLPKANEEEAVKRTEIPGYRILDELESDPSGVWFRARRLTDSSVVVVRVLNPDFSPGINQRFFQERRVLEALDHPHIVRWLDSGQTETGEPYYVLEDVRGVPMLEYAHKNSLDLSRRLELFRQVCSAVSHGHTHLVAHGDIQPPNILVDSDGQAKLAGLGLTRIFDDPTPAVSAVRTKTGMTLTTSRMGSPEQIRGLPVTPTTDVFGLGELLYVLVTGHPAFLRETDSPSQVARAVLGQEAIRPSGIVKRNRSIPKPDGTVITVSAEENARSFGTSVTSLEKKLRGDLDAILLKSLRKSPADRYSTAEHLGADLQRYLDGKPVIARAQTFSYRAGRFVNRHKWWVVLAGLLAIGIAYLFYRENALRRGAQVAATEAHEVSRFLTGLFATSDPLAEPSKNGLLAKDMLDRGAARIEGELSINPRVQASMMDVIGQAYLNLEDSRPAESLFRRSLELRQNFLGPTDPDVASSYRSLSALHASRGQYENAHRLALQAVRQLEQQGMEKTRLMAEAQLHLGNMLVQRSRFTDAEPAFDASLLFFRDNPESNRREIVDLQVRRAALFRQQVRPTEALTAARDAVQRTEKLHPDDILRAKALYEQGLNLRANGILPEAESSTLEALEIVRRVLDRESVWEANCLDNLAGIYLDRGQVETAEFTSREALRIRRENLGSQHPEVGKSLNNLANIVGRRSVSEAIGYYEQALAIHRGNGDAKNPEIASTLYNLGSLYRNQMNLDGAESAFREAWTINRSVLGDANYTVGQDLEALARVLVMQNKLPEAESHFRGAVEIYRRAFPANHPELADILDRLGRMLVSRDRSVEAVELFRESLQIRESQADPDLDRVDESRYFLGLTLAARGDYAEADRLLTKAFESSNTRKGLAHASTQEVVRELISLYTLQGNVEGVRKYEEKRVR